ncbi:MAG: M1 family metallopeptidase [Sphingobacteriales bacterium]|nr:M1 family metallopeptidase [Sphingobacteriales bacterium]
MKRIGLVILLFFSIANIAAQSNYNPKEAFSQDFYPFPGNEYRSAGGEPGPRYWQNRADYMINCSLDTILHEVKGNVDIAYINNSPDNLKFVWLQLDQNIYKKDSRGAITNSVARARISNETFTDGLVFSSVSIEHNGKKYFPKYIVTDTRMQIWLQEAIKPSGGKIKILISYSFKVPVFGTDRMGQQKTRNGNIYEIAQWYPRMCVYDDVQGWNVLPYLGQGEFYLEYGDFEFWVKAPGNMIVVGSGELLNPAECFSQNELAKYNAAKNSETTVIIRSVEDVKKSDALQKKQPITWKFKIQNARDVAWAASKAFVLDGAKINLAGGKKGLALSAYPEESIRKNGWQRSTEMVKGAIEFYSNTYFQYPYPAAVNVDGIVGGMEYPGIVFCGYADAGGGLWNVTNHEFGHTWFPMIVGSNERRDAWMDEGFNSFINDFATKSFNNGEFKDASFFMESMLTTKWEFGDKMDMLNTAADVLQVENLGVAAYYKPAKMLRMLRNVVLGTERFDAAFKEYIRRWAYKHPTPWDFFRTMENVAGEDLAWFWRGWIFNNWKLEQAVTNVSYNTGLPINGAIVTLENREKMVMPVEVQIKEKNGNQQLLNLPAEIWQRSNEYRLKVNSTSEISEVIIDPDKKLPEWDRTNNVWRAK